MVSDKEKMLEALVELEEDHEAGEIQDEAYRNIRDSYKQSLSEILKDERASLVGAARRSLTVFMLVVALLLLIASWIWQKDIQSELENNPSRDLSDAADKVNTLHNVSIALAIFGGIVTASSLARK